ncbi:carbamate kinase [Paenibacillus macerans]|uniref:Carbamate kinase n=1 Tax=Paenibacillus macerans TaxID=44252 RepID=A0A090ZKT8_PAEMA|nr:carbamate kinase [Paenibacillus macerans]KFN11232.1 carbamate kinase [Paenibacillus macerans]MCY7560196.1 carbamate kinase [Paenibacillus macerans]MEC0136437.1 carbamate kinase [Paenibacillus macerans]MEC0151250.1 carbamate kinase [Paenibacillus macerans]MUG25217.1 carbamate kinase [Paenibacillus macerans]
MTRRKIVVALGGNAIQSGNATAKAQQEALEKTAEQLVKIIENDVDVVFVHGNGPQVGNILLQQKAAESEKTPAMPLDTCGAMSQGMIGYWMGNAIAKVLRKQNINKDVVTIVTRVVVDEKDEAFNNPTKPIGPFYTEDEARDLMKETKVVFKEDAGRGWRRVVPSPTPVSILEYKVIDSLVKAGNIVIAVGGGGNPVIHGKEGLTGTEAVIDKDFAAQKLAELVEADTLVILTAVDFVYVNFNKPNQKRLESVTVDELEGYVKEQHFAAGSMLPKIEAAINFVNANSERKAIITSLDKVNEALEGKTGTVISKQKGPVHA